MGGVGVGRPGWANSFIPPLEATRAWERGCALPGPPEREQGTELHTVPAPAGRVKRPGRGGPWSTDRGVGGRPRWGGSHALRFCSQRKTK